jgi:hypothetical protein
MLATFTLIAALGLASPADSVRSDSEIREVVLRHADAVRLCYENEGLSRNTNLSGTVEVELRILPVGRVDSVRVIRTGLKGPGTREVADCIAAIARNWRFTRGPYSVELIILPFSLKPVRSSSNEQAASTQRT